jgi:hypothetical protein
LPFTVHPLLAGYAPWGVFLKPHLGGWGVKTRDYRVVRAKKDAPSMPYNFSL